MNKHTPGPYHVGMKPGPIIYGPRGEQIADCRSSTNTPDENKAHAAVIVKACNEHEELTEIKEQVADALAMLQAPGFDNDGGPSNIADEVRVLLDNINALAGGKARLDDVLDLLETIWLAANGYLYANNGNYYDMVARLEKIREEAGG